MENTWHFLIYLFSEHNPEKKQRRDADWQSGQYEEYNSLTEIADTGQRGMGKPFPSSIHGGYKRGTANGWESIQVFIQYCFLACGAAVHDSLRSADFGFVLFNLCNNALLESYRRD